jgi:5-methylcytosine-specific restriction protein A
MKAARPCNYPRCPELITSGSYCTNHQRALWRQQNAERRDRSPYGAAWRRARARFLREHPDCAECKRQGHTTPATVVDHVRPHRGDPVLFWDETNWASSCKSHHDAKTRRGQ